MKHSNYFPILGRLGLLHPSRYFLYLFTLNFQPNQLTICGLYDKINCLKDFREIISTKEGEMSELDRQKEQDDFWNIDKLVPKKRASLSPFASRDVAREYDLPAPTGADTDEADSGAERRLNLADAKGVKTSVATSYEFEGDSLLRRVTVRQFIDRYDFYDNFRKAALIFYDYKTDKCEFAQFYSYMPQYSQMNTAQKNYYFYWRSEMKRGRFIKTDYSYVYLYVYEILNLPDKIPPEEGIKLLCRLWREYRATLPRLDAYFSIWVQDYCLVHRLDCPMTELYDFIFDVISAASFKEFYLSDINRAGAAGTTAMLAYLSDYDWRRGKFAFGSPDDPKEKRESDALVYRTHMESAMSLLLRSLWGELVRDGRRGEPKLIRRDAFPNSLCTHMVKRKLEIEYYPISEAQGLRRSITAAVRYAENKIRALMGIKSRLAVRDLPDDYKSVLDYYFEAIFDKEQRKRDRESAPAYERLYDAPSEELSMTGADEIERASWTTTMRLVDTDEYPDACNIAEKSENTVEPEQQADSTLEASAEVPTYGLGSEQISYLASFFGCGDLDRNEIQGMSEVGLAEEINEAFADGFGDVILESCEDGYRIIEDYYEEIQEWLKKIMK